MGLGAKCNHDTPGKIEKSIFIFGRWANKLLRIKKITLDMHFNEPQNDQFLISYEAETKIQLSHNKIQKKTSLK